MFDPGRVIFKTLKMVVTGFLLNTQHIGKRETNVWLGDKLMCLIGVTYMYLLVDVCFSDLAHQKLAQHVGLV